MKHILSLTYHIAGFIQPIILQVTDEFRQSLDPGGQQYLDSVLHKLDDIVQANLKEQQGKLQVS